jgi:hypothetical protein
MDWKNSGKGHLPVNDQEVLISVDNIKYVAVYDAVSKQFVVNDQKAKAFPVQNHVVYWTEIKKI